MVGYQGVAESWTTNLRWKECVPPQVLLKVAKTFVRSSIIIQNALYSGDFQMFSPDPWLELLELSPVYFHCGPRALTIVVGVPGLCANAT
jgi:hypothetical protein